MALPVDISSSHHLLFSFGHVAVNAASSETKPIGGSPSEPIESPCGYAWLPLLKADQRLSLENDEQDFLLPVAVDLQDGYLASRPVGLTKVRRKLVLGCNNILQGSGPDIRWVEGGRPLFKVRVKLVSSVFSTESKVQGFFQACQKLEKWGTLGDVNEANQTKVDSCIFVPLLVTTLA